MKILGMVLGFCLLTSLAFGEVSSKVVGLEQEENGNIKIVSEVRFNGERVKSNYPDGNWRVPYSAMTISKEFILRDLKRHCERIVWKEFNKKKNQTNIDLQNQLSINNPNKFTNISYKTSTTTRKLDKDSDGDIDEIWTIKDDGTVTITPVP